MGIFFNERSAYTLAVYIAFDIIRFGYNVEMLKAPAANVRYRFIWVGFGVDYVATKKAYQAIDESEKFIQYCIPCQILGYYTQYRV